MLMANYWAIESKVITRRDRYGYAADLAEWLELELKDSSKLKQSGLDYLQPLQKGAMFQRSLMGYGSKPENRDAINAETLCPRCEILVREMRLLRRDQTNEKFKSGFCKHLVMLC